MAKILLVEDDNNLREIYEARLQAEGYTIVTAKDGEEALVVAKNEKPNLIISDIMMPKISGFEMLDILRNTEGLKDVKIVMLTALGQAEDQTRANSLGADRYLVKSQVTLEDIVKAAKELLGESPSTDSTPPAGPSEPDQPPSSPPATPSTTDDASANSTVASPASDDPVAKADEPAGDAAVATPADTPVADPPAQTTAQEEAGVEARIEDFVEGASSEATPSESTASVAPALATPAVADPAKDAPSLPEGFTVAEPGSDVMGAASNLADSPLVSPAPTSADDASSSSTTKADDQLMANAVDTLVANTEDQTPDTANTSEPTLAPSGESDDQPSTTATPPPSEQAEKVEKEADDEPPKSDHVTVAHKKVIQPLEQQAKPDLNTLVALEEAKEAATAPVAPAQPVISDVTAPPPKQEDSAVVSSDNPSSSTAKEGGIDPNTVAL